MATPGDSAWRGERLAQLLEFASGARLDAGFGRLGRDGLPQSATLELWINARMTYVFSSAVRAGDGAWLPLATHGVEVLTSVFTDQANGGWFSQVGPTGDPVTTTKSCYDHAFVLLAASAAQRAEIPGAAALFDRAGAVHTEQFWSESDRRCVDERSQDWTEISSYRGANSNMHSLEAYLAASDAGGGTDWLSRAADIARFFVDVQARQNSWRIPEHYTADWEPDLGYNTDKVDDPFRPYGATPGHGLEWARLLLELEARLPGDPQPWLLEGAQALFDRAVTDGLSATTAGLPYTTDWEGKVVMASRFHWVMAEAVQAAEALSRRTGESRYADLRDRWWGEIDRWFIAGDNGLWNHELDEHLQVAGRTWPDAPDAYHAYNALTPSVDQGDQGD